MTALFLGGARSGKSQAAEAWVTTGPQDPQGAAPLYLATAEALDAEMAERIARHRADRGAGWETIDAPQDLAEAVTTARASGPRRPMLIDCLTLWLSNRLLADADLAAESAVLADAIAKAGATGPLAVVSNEVGLGIVPDNALARRFRDAQGRLNQAVAAEADTVVFMAAGLPMVLKGSLYAGGPEAGR